MLPCTSNPTEKCYPARAILQKSATLQVQPNTKVLLCNYKKCYSWSATLQKSSIAISLHVHRAILKELPSAGYPPPRASLYALPFIWYMYMLIRDDLTWCRICATKIVWRMKVVQCQPLYRIEYVPPPPPLCLPFFGADFSYWKCRDRAVSSPHPPPPQPSKNNY